MKFTTAAYALLALPLMTMATAIPAAKPAELAVAEVQNEPALLKRNCVLQTWWDSNWPDFWSRRYRVRGIATAGGSQTNTRAMLEEWCRLFKHKAVFDRWDMENAQCWLESDTLAWADVSTYIGEDGLNRYRDHNQNVVNAWRDWSGGCDVDSRF